MKVTLKELLTKIVSVLSKGMVYTITETALYSVNGNSIGVAWLNSTYNQSADCITITATFDHSYLSHAVDRGDGYVAIWNHYGATQSGTATITYFMKA